MSQTLLERFCKERWGELKDKFCWGLNLPFRYLYKMFNYKKIPKLIIFIFFMNSLFNLLSHSSTSIGSSPTLVWNCGIRYFFEEAPGRLFNFYLFINIFALWTGSFFLFLLISLENWDSFGVNVSFNQREASHEKLSPCRPFMMKLLLILQPHEFTWKLLLHGLARRWGTSSLAVKSSLI